MALKKARATSKLLIELEALMQGYQPSKPVEPDAPNKCLTKVAEENDPAGAKVERLLAADHRKQVEAARQKAAEIQKHFDEVDLPLAWTWVSAIVPGHEFEILPGVKVTEPTELMKRLQTRPDLVVDATQHCIVAEAELSEKSLVVTCRGPRRGEREFFYFQAEPAAGKAGGSLAAVGVGDLVEFAGHLVLTHRAREWRAPAYWSFQNVPAEKTKVAAQSTCCHGK